MNTRAPAHNRMAATGNQIYGNPAIGSDADAQKKRDDRMAAMLAACAQEEGVRAEEAENKKYKI